MPTNKSRRCLKLDWAIYLHELELRVFGNAHGHSKELNKAGLSAAEVDYELLREKTQHHSVSVREQAAKQLGASSHPAACYALIDLLKDGSHEVSWAAMHSLIHLRRIAVRPLLEELTRDFQSSCFRSAVRHIFVELHRLGDLNEVEAQVLHLLIHHGDNGLLIAQVANRALMSSHHQPVAHAN